MAATDSHTWATNHERWSTEYASIAPPAWAVEFDDWDNYGASEPLVLRACRSMRHRGNGVEVFHTAMQLADTGVTDDPVFVVNVSRGRLVDTIEPNAKQAQTLLTALNKALAEVENAVNKIDAASAGLSTKTDASK